MNDDENKFERIWSFVHEVGDGEDLAGFEESLAEDSGLQDEVKKAELTERYLRTLAPAVGVDLEELERKIIRTWDKEVWQHEADRADEGEAAHAQPVVKESRPAAKLIQFPYARLSALAACFLAFAGVWAFFGMGPLGWMAREIAPLTPRGAIQGAAQGVYTTELLDDLGAELQESIERAYTSLPGGTHRSWFDRSRDWNLQLSVHELDGGLLSIQIHAYGKDRSTIARSWAVEYDNPEEFRAGIESFAANIATELDRMKNE